MNSPTDSGNGKTPHGAVKGSEGAKVRAAVYDALVSDHLDQKKAAKLAQMTADIFDYVDAHPALKKTLMEVGTLGPGGYAFYKYGKAAKDAYTGSKTVEQVVGYLRNAKLLNLTSSTEGFAKVLGRGSFEGLGGFVDLFEGAAKANGIPLTDWCLSVAKVAIAFGTVLAATEAIGVIAAALLVITVLTECYSIGTAAYKALGGK